MSLFPIFVKLQDQLVVVIGGGKIAAGKIPGLLEARAQIRLIAPEVNSEIADWVAAGKIDWQPKKFAPEDLQGSQIVVAATSIASVNAAVFQEAEKRGIFCNAVDDIGNCRFYYGAIVQRGDLQIAISTNGKSPALAQRVRKALEQQYPEDYGPWLDSLGSTRERLRVTSKNFEENKSVLHRLASDEMYRRFVRFGKTNEPLPATGAPGKVYLVGAGPGDPELLTVRAVRLVREADIVLHDSLVGPEILALVSPKAEIIDVGKRAGSKLLTQ